MKHIYYGVKKQKKVHFSKYELQGIDYMLSNNHKSSYYYRDCRVKLESCIVALKARCSNIGRLFSTSDTFVENVIIYQTHRGHVNKENDYVEFNNILGKDKILVQITSRHYEPIQDTMHYYTGIIVEELPLDEEEFEKIRLEVLEKAEAIYEKHFNSEVNVEECVEDDKKSSEESKEEVEEDSDKGFFKKLFRKIFN
jgi:hypothetical protein